MTTDIARQEPLRWVAPMNAEDAAAALAHVLGTGDLYQLTNEQRVAHYLNRCRSAGLSPLDRPYQWIEFKEGENSPAVLTLYFKPTAAAQALRNNHISVHYPRREIVGELFVCEAHGTAPDGREGAGTKYVPLVGKYGRLTGRHLANAYMSAETGALRRLAINMGVASGPDPEDDGPSRAGISTASTSIRTVYVDGTGAVISQPTEQQRHLAEHPEVARAIGEPTYESTSADWPEVVPDVPDIRPRPEELDRPKRTGPRPTLRPTKEQVDAWQKAWFACVAGSSLSSDDARHRYTRQWTATEGWPEGKQTDSLRTALGRMTEREAEDFLGHVRALVEDERRANEEALAEARGEGPPMEAHDEDGAF
jgi:hypothetical protein